MIYSYAGVWYYDALDRTCVYYENKCAVIIHGNARETQMHFWSRHPYAHVQVFTIYIYMYIFLRSYLKGQSCSLILFAINDFLFAGYPLSHTCNMFFLQCRRKSSQPRSYQTKILGTLAHHAILLLVIQLLVIIQPSIQPNHHLEPHRGWLSMGDPGDGVPNHLWRVIGENGLLVRQEVLWCFSMLSKRDHLKGETAMLYHSFNQNHISAWWSGSIPKIGYKMALWMGKMVIMIQSHSSGGGWLNSIFVPFS